MTASNTGRNRGHFTKGDPRINRNGRPKSFDGLRTLARQIALEFVAAAIRRWVDVTGGEPVLLGS